MQAKQEQRQEHMELAKENIKTGTNNLAKADNQGNCKQNCIPGSVILKVGTCYVGPHVWVGGG